MLIATQLVGFGGVGADSAGGGGITDLATWTAKATGIHSSVNSMDASSDGTRIVLHVGTAAPRYSTDSGASFSSSTGFSATFGSKYITMGGDNLTVIAGSGTGGSTYISRDGGQTYAFNWGGGWGFPSRRSPNGAYVIGYEPGSGTAISTDYGDTFGSNLAGAIGACMAISDDGQKVYVGNQSNSNIRYSTNGGASFSLTSVTSTLGVACCSGDGSVVLNASLNGTLSLSTDGGVTWSDKGNSGLYTDCSMSSDGQLMLAVGANCAVMSTDGGATWNNLAGAGLPASGGKCCVILADGSKAYVVGSDFVLYAA